MAKRKQVVWQIERILAEDVAAFSVRAGVHTNAAEATAEEILEATLDALESNGFSVDRRDLLLMRKKDHAAFTRFATAVIHGFPERDANDNI